MTAAWCVLPGETSPVAGGSRAAAVLFDCISRKHCGKLKQREAGRQRGPLVVRAGAGISQLGWC